VTMRPPFTLEIAFSSGIPSISGAAMESAAKERSWKLLGPAGLDHLAARHQAFESRCDLIQCQLKAGSVIAYVLLPPVCVLHFAMMFTSVVVLERGADFS
jgi:hypothetical protein